MSLPQGWAASTLKEMANSMGGGTPSTTDASYWEEGTIPWVSPKDMKVFRLRETIDRVTDKALERLPVVPTDSLLVVVRSGILSRTLPVAINSQPVVLNQDMRAFVPVRGVDVAFLAWQLIAHGPEVLDKCTKDGTTVASIEAEQLANFPLLLAPNAEQARVVSAIESVIAVLDAATADLHAAKRKLAIYRRSLLKSAVDGSLTAEWRVLMGAPEWNTLTAAQVCDFITKGTTPPKALKGPEEQTVPFLRVTNLTQNGQLNFVDRVFVSEATHRGLLARSVVRPGDVLMNIVGPPLGQVALVPAAYAEWNVNQAIAIFRPCSGLVSNFLKLVLLAPSTLRWFEARAKTTAGQTNLTLEVCRALPLKLPSESEQNEIVRMVSSRWELAAANEAAIDQALAMATAQRQNILRAAFSGRLVPQDPSDEPASVLLDRIRTQRIASVAAEPRAKRRTAPRLAG